MMGTMALPSVLLELADWNAADADTRLEVATKTFAANGCGRPRFETCGPPEKPITVAIATHETTGVEFALVPGGTVVCGIGDAGWAKLIDFARKEGVPPQVYGSTENPSIAREGPGPQRVEPMLMATFPITAAMRGLEPLLSKDKFERNVREDAWKDHSRFYPLSLEELTALEKHTGWQMPHGFQLEWGITAGRDALFYWGDELDYDALCGPDGHHHPMLEIRDDPKRVWPAKSAFGLRSPVSIPQWCWFGAPDERVTFVRGGAGWCAPWQGCGEVLWMVNFMIAGTDTFEEHVKTHALRPVVPLR